jgi:hypothetical protein
MVRLAPLGNRSENERALGGSKTVMQVRSGYKKERIGLSRALNRRRRPRLALDTWNSISSLPTSNSFETEICLA